MRYTVSSKLVPIGWGVTDCLALRVFFMPLPARLAEHGCVPNRGSTVGRTSCAKLCPAPGTFPSIVQTQFGAYLLEYHQTYYVGRILPMVKKCAPLHSLKLFLIPLPQKTTLAEFVLAIPPFSSSFGVDTAFALPPCGNSPSVILLRDRLEEF